MKNRNIGRQHDGDTFYWRDRLHATQCALGQVKDNVARLERCGARQAAAKLRSTLKSLQGAVNHARARAGR